MSLLQTTPLKWRVSGVASVLSLVAQMISPALSPAQNARTGASKTPIQHMIVIIGENRTFDHIFATYKPVKGQKVDNLLSKGIINEDGSPGPNFFGGSQWSAVDSRADKYQISPSSRTLFSNLPAPLAGGPTKPYIRSVAVAQKIENGLLPEDYVLMTTGGTGLPHGVPDTRIPNVSNLPPGPFPLTSHSLPYDSYANSPVHRFYQMWQQMDCNAAYVTSSNPSGCLNDLFPWVEVTVGAGANGKPQPPGFDLTSTGEGSTSMAFYNVLQGDAPYLKFLADNYAMSDNYHQAVNGGTGANHIMLGTGDAIYFSDGSGNALRPPHNQMVADGSPNAGVVDEIENPNAQPGTNNFYTQDGYGGGSYGSPSYGGGSYTNCSDITQPGVAPILNYLSDLPYLVNSRCEPGKYYLLNNYNPGYYGNGKNAYADIGNPAQTVFTIPPSSVRNIGDELLAANISWKYYGDQWNTYVKNPNLNYVALNNQYCNICNPFQYSTSIMTNAAVRTAHLQDTANLYDDIASGNLPAVSYVKPSGWLDGHPASSKLNLFEGFVKKIVTLVQANKALWGSTAIFVTFDEGGGYYDSGYVQALDYFGDGTRIPMIVVSPFTTPGKISHVYSDHVSVLKFIEANWGLPPVSSRSRDNFPNPKPTPGNPYVPSNRPAIGDLMDLFTFKK